MQTNNLSNYVYLDCRNRLPKEEKLFGGNRTKHDKRDAHQKNKIRCLQTSSSTCSPVSNLLIFCSLRCRTELNARISAPVDTAARRPSQSIFKR